MLSPENFIDSDISGSAYKEEDIETLRSTLSSDSEHLVLSEKTLNKIQALDKHGFKEEVLQMLGGQKESGNYNWDSVQPELVASSYQKYISRVRIAQETIDCIEEILRRYGNPERQQTICLEAVEAWREESENSGSGSIRRFSEKYGLVGSLTS